MTVPHPRRTANRHPELAADLRRILARFAQQRPDETGLLLCEPRDIELRFHPKPGNPAWTANNGKVCFETMSQAKRAADAIEELPGADPVDSYACPRGDHYHHVSRARRADTAWATMTRIALAAQRRGAQ